MTMEIFLKAIILKIKREEKESIISAKDVFYNLSLTQIHLKYQK